MFRERRRSVDADYAVDGFPFGRPQQALMGDADRMEGAFQLAPPVIEKALEGGEMGGEIVILPDEELEQGGMVRQAVVDLGGG